VSSIPNPISYPLILKTLSGSIGHYLPYEDIEKRTGLGRNAIKGAIKHFQESGIKIDETPHGCALISLPDIILPDIVLSGLRSRIMGREIHSYKSVGSTNEVAKRLAEAKAPEGTAVISERQTRGRGRLGRSWHSPSGQGLYFSLILRPRVSFEKMPALSLVAALSVCHALERLDGMKAKIKWPNDCLIDNKKVAGILVEVSAELDSVGYAILGIGINVNNQRRDFPSGLRSRATSLAISVGKRVDRVTLLRHFLVDFEKLYTNFHRYGLRFLGPELVERSVVLGKKITISLGKKKISGMAQGFDQNGSLRLLVGNEVLTISAGEVSLR